MTGMSKTRCSGLDMAKHNGRAKRVLIYGINFSPEPIGTGKYTGELAAYLAGQGLEVDVVTAIPHYPGWRPRSGYANRHKVDIIDGCRVHHCPIWLPKKMGGLARALSPFSFALASAPVVFWRMLTHRPDTVFCVEPTLFSAPFALIWAKLLGVRSLLHVQDLEIDAAFAVGHLGGRMPKALARWYERTVLRGFDGVITISNKMREKLAEKGVRPERLHMIRNWVDTKDIHPMAGISPMRTEFGIPDTDFVVLYSGNLGPKQALPLILNVAEKLKDQSEFRFVIAGEGPVKADLQADVKKRGLKNVQFIPLQPKEKLCALLNMADAHILPQMPGTADLVLPSKLGGMLASGKPCVVMADRGTEMYEFLAGAVYLVPCGDVAESVKLFSSACCAVPERLSGREACLSALRADKAKSLLLKYIVNIQI